MDVNAGHVNNYILEAVATCCICADHMDSLLDWAWTLQFEHKMACDVLQVVGQWD